MPRSDGDGDGVADGHGDCEGEDDCGGDGGNNDDVCGDDDGGTDGGYTMCVYVASDKCMWHIPFNKGGAVVNANTETLKRR